MLYLYLGNIDRRKLFGEKYEPLTQQYFDAGFKAEWMNSKLVHDIVLDVDKSEVLSANTIVSPVFGQIPRQMLSTGVKTLIVMLNVDGLVISGERLGDNCWKWVFEICKQKDVTVALNHTFWECEFFEEVECIVINGNNFHFKGDAEEFMKMWMQFKAQAGHVKFCKEERYPYRPLTGGKYYDAFKDIATNGINIFE